MTARDNVQRHRTFLPCAAALLALGTLGACTSSGAAGSPGASSPASTSAGSTSKAPSSTSTTSAAPSPTTSTDPVIAKIPPAARGETEAGGKAFAAFFLNSLDRAAMAADPSILDGLFDEGCKTCVAMVDSVAQLQKAGNHHSGPTLKVVQVTTDSFVTERRIVIAQVDQKAVDVVNKRGQRVDRTLAAKGAFAMTLRYARAHWTISRLQTVAR
ncbi:hypothetical protein GCM10009817_31080 [Terrabacter lapilli]|uniref:DUF6318 domain-containing protein n=1 Tax=Terrabacter lapilli TaxID=436231 RepID=A0ABN2SKK3_9MICO